MQPAFGAKHACCRPLSGAWDTNFDKKTTVFAIMSHLYLTKILNMVH